MKKILGLFFMLSILSYGNTKHINYIMNRNSKLSREEATKIYEILNSNSKKYNVDLNLHYYYFLLILHFQFLT